MKVEFDLARQRTPQANEGLVEAVGQEMIKKLEEAHRWTCNGGGKGEDFLGWRDLPQTIAAEQLSKLQKVARLMQQKAEVMVVIGIGGSYLGAKAVISALQSCFAEYKKSHFPTIFFAGNNLSEDYLADLLELLKRKEYCLCVISKSGTTTEPAIAFRVLRKALEERYGKKEARDRIIAITDEKKGALRQMCEEQGYESFVIEDSVGGRFSVFSPVGLVPAAVAGVDIKELLEGANEQREALIGQMNIENPAWQYAALRNLFYQEGKKIEAFVTYEPQLQSLSAWCQQLFGESEGKDAKGLFPVSMTYSTDLHSLGQYVQEGERIIFETVVSVEKGRKEVLIQQEDKDLDGLNYLASKTLGYVNHTAEEGVRLAHIEGGVPQIRLVMPELTAKEIGRLLYFFEFSCALSAYVLGVNPFDQPGVEAYKKSMFALLGKPKA